MAIEYKIEDLKIDTSKNIIYDMNTGEVIEDIEDIIGILNQNSKDNRINNAKVKQVRKMFDLQEKKDTHYLGWKRESYFMKIYRTEMREYMQVAELSANASALFFHMQMYIEYETNRLAKPDGTSFTNAELQELTSLGHVQLKNALNELEEKLFIKRVGQRQAREIYFNPYLATAGNEILKTTVQLFAEYKPITPY